MSFAEGLKKARIKKGLTQAQLGELIGVANTTISGYEKGTSEASEDKIYALLKVLDVDANALFSWSDEMLESKEPPPLEAWAKVFIEHYKSLDDDGRGAVDAILNYELDRKFRREMEEERLLKEQEETVHIFRAASSEDNAESQVLDVPKSKIDKYKNAKEADEI